MLSVKKLLLAIAAVGCLLPWSAGSHDRGLPTTVTTAVRTTTADLTWGP